MTKTIANVDIAINTFGDWVTRLNQNLNALDTVVLTVDNNVTTGNAIVNGTFQANNIFVNNLSGGTIAIPSTLTLDSEVTFTSNTLFSGANTSFGDVSTKGIHRLGANSTYKYWYTDPTDGLQKFDTLRLDTSIQDVNISTPANENLLVYSSANTLWENKPIGSLTILNTDITGLGNSSVKNTGVGNGLDADTVDTLEASQFVRSDVGDTVSGDITFSSKIISNSISEISSGTTTMSGTTTQNVVTFTKTLYRSVKYLVSVDDQLGNYTTSEILLIHDGTTPYKTEYALLDTGVTTGVFTVDINVNDVRLRFTPTVTGTVINWMLLGII